MKCGYKAILILTLCLILNVILAIGIRLRGTPFIRKIDRKECDTPLGKSREGAHKIRILDTAIVDFILTLMLASILSKISKAPLIPWLVYLFVTGEMIHFAFSIHTSTYRWLWTKK